jgi:Tol biopolymer transport system component
MVRRRTVRPRPASLVACALAGATLLAAVGRDVPAAHASFPGPNGKIAFAGGPGSGWGEIFTMNADGTGLVNLTRSGSVNELAPDWSPDGSRIAFVSNRDGNNEIYVMDADGSDARRLTTNAAWDNHPSWSPDGTQIAFASERTGNREIFVMSAAGSSVRQLTFDPNPDTWPEYSPDGTQLAFTRLRQDVSAVYTIPVDGGSVRQVTPDALNGGQADWSPDGKRFVLVNNHCGACSASDVFTIRTNGRQLTQLTRDFGNNLNPSWSPDGTKIVFWNSRVLSSGGLSHPADIWAMSADGTGRTNLTNTPGDRDVLPDWGPLGSG